MHGIHKYFNDQKWTLQDFINNKWTKLTDHKVYYLGKQKNNRGEPINCKGVVIDDYGSVHIAAFNQYGKRTKPYILITKEDFIIFE